MIKVKVIGASGYGGIGIVELLLRHPEARIQSLVALESVGQPISEIWPHLAGFCDLVVQPRTARRRRSPRMSSSSPRRTAWA